MTEQPIKVSFIIPHKGREEMLQQTLQSIAEQKFSKDRIEVLLVTQNETIASDTLPKDKSIQMAVLHRPASDTISHLRNYGVQQSSGEYLAFLDADVEIAPNWIEAMLAEIENKAGRVLVSAVQRCSQDAPPLELIRTALSNAVTDAAVRFLPGRNLFMRKETFHAAGGFPEHLVTCEDYYFTDQVHGLGELYYSSASSYIHLGEDREYNAMFKKEIWRGQSNLQSIKGRRIPLSEWPSFLVPLWILGFALLAVVSLMTLHLKAAAMLIVTGLLPVFIYSWRLYHMAQGQVSFLDVVRFYALYFPARIIGTLRGLIQPIQI